MLQNFELGDWAGLSPLVIGTEEERLPEVELAPDLDEPEEDQETGPEEWLGAIGLRADGRRRADEDEDFDEDFEEDEEFEDEDEDLDDDFEDEEFEEDEDVDEDLDEDLDDDDL